VEAVIALLTCSAILAPFAALLIRLGMWLERTRPTPPPTLMASPRVIARHPSCTRGSHVTPLYVVPDPEPAPVVPIFDFDALGGDIA
jgi:hypothetical protein